MLLIDGKWISGQGKEVASCNPADGATIFKTHSANSSQIAEAIGAACRAAASWAQIPAGDRIARVRAWGHAVDARQEELAQRITREIGKPYWEAKTEVASCIAKVTISIEAATERLPERTRATSWGNESLHYAPLGAMFVIGPYNFPAHLPGGHIIPALLAGNTIVFKPSDKAPSVGQWLAELWHEFLPPGVFNLIQGDASVAQKAIDDVRLAGVLFTGSHRTGQHITRQLADRPEMMVALEMGGNNPLVIVNPHDLPAAVTITAISAYLSSGQRCTCARRLIVVDTPTGRAFVARLCQSIARIRCGLPYDQPPPFLGPLVSTQAAAQVLQQYQQRLDQGAVPLVGMQANDRCPALLTPGLIDLTNLQGESLDEEIFGPLLQLTWVRDLDSAIAQANATRYGLAAGMIGGTAEQFERFRRSVRAGVFSWNRPMTGASGRLPFGGIGRSGNYRPSGYFATDYCAYPIAVQQSSSLTVPTDLPPGLDRDLA
jgi:succinylglutamic semialdehyde dehydrogenase